MYIKLTKIYDGDMGGYDARFVVGTKLDNPSETWEKGFFSNNEDLMNALENFGIGENVNVVLERNPKNKKFYNIVDFKEMTDADYARIGDTPKYSGGGGGTKKTSGTKSGSNGGGDKMTKAEWAEKDRITNIRIAKAVALKAAVDSGKTAPKAAMDWAEKVLPWLLDTTLTGEAEAIAGKKSSADPLDPPI